MEIVALKQKVDDNINNIIAKFVCCHRTAEIITALIREHKFCTSAYIKDWDFLKFVYTRRMHWKYCSNCYRKLRHEQLIRCGGRCPNCSIHRYDLTAREVISLRMNYNWTDPFNFPRWVSVEGITVEESDSDLDSDTDSD